MGDPARAEGDALSKAEQDRVVSVAHTETDRKIRIIPELTPEMFARAIVRRGLKSPPRKRQLTLRVDEDVLKWFRAQGRGYQTQINAFRRVLDKGLAER